MQNSLYWLGSMNNVLIAKENSVNFINDLKQVIFFRSEYLYNNLGYEIAAHILDKATAEPWHRLYTAFLEAAAHQFEHQVTSTPGNPLKQVSFLFSPKIAINRISLRENSYALGWARLQTPGPMGAIGLNPRLLAPKPAPTIARDHSSSLILYQQGMMPGNLAAVNLVPSTKGAIIVLSNSLALNDTADWLGQLYLEAYLGVQNRNDYVALSTESAEAALGWQSRVVAELLRNQIQGTRHRCLPEYAGTYHNDALTMQTKIFVDDDGGEACLKLAFQGLESKIYPLSHYHHDEFTWLVSRNEFARRGRFTNHDAKYFKICFGAESPESPLTYFTWWHDKFLHEPGKFTLSITGHG
ncbi:MAG: hypothetical protein Q9221_005670 [Calogaya cf. arnoldii]